jgi:hypothetical protein
LVPSEEEQERMRRFSLLKFPRQSDFPELKASTRRTAYLKKAKKTIKFDMNNNKEKEILTSQQSMSSFKSSLNDLDIQSNSIASPKTFHQPIVVQLTSSRPSSIKQDL